MLWGVKFSKATNSLIPGSPYTEGHRDQAEIVGIRKKSGRNLEKKARICLEGHFDPPPFELLEFKELVQEEEKERERKKREYYSKE